MLNLDVKFDVEMIVIKKMIQKKKCVDLIEQHTKIGWHNLLEGFPAKMGTATGGTSGKNRKQVKSMMESSSGKEDRVSHMANVGSQKFSEQ